jgi:hypothetical protein
VLVLASGVMSFVLLGRRRESEAGRSSNPASSTTAG